MRKWEKGGKIEGYQGPLSLYLYSGVFSWTGPSGPDLASKLSLDYRQVSSNHEATWNSTDCFIQFPQWIPLHSVSDINCSNQSVSSIPACVFSPSKHPTSWPHGMWGVAGGWWMAAAWICGWAYTSWWIRISSLQPWITQRITRRDCCDC